MLVLQNESFGLKIAVSRSANHRSASYNSMSKNKVKKISLNIIVIAIRNLQKIKNQSQRCATNKRTSEENVKNENNSRTEISQ